MRDVASEIAEGTRKALASVGTMWLNTPRIDVKAEGSNPVDAGVHAGEHAPLIDNVNPINEVMWIALGICVLSLILAGVRMAWHARGGESQQHADRLGTILFATILISGGVGLVGVGKVGWWVVWSGVFAWSGVCWW